MVGLPLERRFEDTMAPVLTKSYRNATAAVTLLRLIYGIYMESYNAFEHGVRNDLETLTLIWFHYRGFPINNPLMS